MDITLWLGRAVQHAGGLIYGAWIDGTSIVLLAGYPLAFLALLAAGLFWMDKRNRRVAAQRVA